MIKNQNFYSGFTVVVVVVFFVICCMPTCSEGGKVIFTELNQVSINTSYRPLIFKSGTLTLKKDSSVLYFFNTNTYGRIDFFSENGILIKTIPLDKVKRKCVGINNIAILNTDSIVVLSQNSNQILLLNGEGEVLNEKIFYDFDFKNFTVELTSSILSGFLFNNNQLLLKCTYYPSNRENSFKKFYDFNKQSCFFASIPLNEVFTDKAKLHHHFPGFYSSFLKHNECSVEPPFYVFAEKNILLGSRYTDTIYVLGTDFKIKHKIKLISRYTKIKCPAVTYELMGKDSLDFQLSTSGIISNMTYDKYRELYYITLLHSVDKTLSPEEIISNRRSSVLIYNKDFSFLEEILIPKTHYGEIFVVKSGLLLKINENNETSPYKYTLNHVTVK